MDDFTYFINEPYPIDTTSLTAACSSHTIYRPAETKWATSTILPTDRDYIVRSMA